MRMSETHSEGLCYPEDVGLLRDSESQGGFGISNTSNGSSAMALLGCESRKCLKCGCYSRCYGHLAASWLPHMKEASPPPSPRLLKSELFPNNTKYPFGNKIIPTEKHWSNDGGSEKPVGGIIRKARVWWEFSGKLMSPAAGWIIYLHSMS